MTQLENMIDENEDKHLIYAKKSLDNNPEAVFWVGQYGKVLYVNKAACQKLGYSKEELLKMTVADFDVQYPKYTWHPNSEFVQMMKSGEITRFQTLHRHRDGHLIPVEIVNSNISHQEDGIGCSFVRDITDRIKLQEQQENFYARLSILNKIAQKTNEEFNAAILLRETASILINSLPIDALLFYLIDEKSRRLTLIHGIGLPDQLVDTVRRTGKLFGAADNAVLRKRMMDTKFEDMRDDHLCNQFLKNGFTNAASFPISEGEELFGGITLISRTDRPINELDQGLLTAICSQLSTNIKKARLFDSLKKEIQERKHTEQQLKKANAELEKSASTDLLTGTWNRRFFFSAVEAEMKRCRRYENPMSILLFDIDNFKEINDSFGHQTGDRVLVEFAKVLTASIRETDSLTRWGGEEFIVLAPNLNENDAGQLAERLRVLIEAHNFQLPVPVTVSIGIVEFDPDDDLDAWLKKADDALYRAKGAGRNRVELSDYGEDVQAPNH